MTTFHPTSRSVVALTAVLATSALLLTSCANGTDGFHPHPRGGNRTTAAATTEANSDLQQSVVVSTESGSVTLTAENSELVFGQSATIATIDDNDHLLTWTLRVEQAVVPDPRAVKLAEPNDLPGTDAVFPEVANYLCFVYTVTFQGIGRSSGTNSLVVDGSPEPSATVVTRPSLTPSLETGQDTNEVLGSAAESCGIPAADRLPSVEKDLVTGRTYREAVVGFQAGDTPESTPTVIRFDYDPRVPDASTDIAHPSSIFWGMA